MKESSIPSRHNGIFIFLQFSFKSKLNRKLWNWLETLETRIFLRKEIKNGGNVIGVKN